MPSEIHVTDTQGRTQTYSLVSARWVRLITLMVFFMVVMVGIIAYVMVKEVTLSTDSYNFRKSERRRNLVFNELTQNRTHAIEQMHDQICDTRARLGMECPPMPDITIDPKKYPDVLNPDGRTFRTDTASTQETK
jgi:hypothetical protein